MNTQICPETSDFDTARYSVLYALVTGTLDLQTAKGLIPGGMGHRCEGQWGFNYGGDPRRCEESLYFSCETQHPRIILTMREEPWDVIGLTQNPRMPIAIDDLEEFLDVSDPLFDTAPVSRVTHYLWANGRTEEKIYNSPLFNEIWGHSMHSIFNIPECGWLDFDNSSKNEVVS